MSDQRKVPIRHLQWNIHYTCQLQRDLPSAWAVTQQWGTVPFCNIIWMPNTINLMWKLSISLNYPNDGNVYTITAAVSVMGESNSVCPHWLAMGDIIFHHAMYFHMSTFDMMVLGQPLLTWPNNELAMMSNYSGVLQVSYISFLIVQHTFQ